ncbi:MAG: BapA prefix-like domain-containing protein, partial [Zoogloeaceae bacterium]|nr:BapA prefix-like domain-containing protein [Zoogloeaceae bacterium]
MAQDNGLTTDRQIKDARGFPLTPPEKRANVTDATLVNVALGQTVKANGGLHEVFTIHAHREDVVNFAKEGNDLVIEFADGTRIVIQDFFAPANEQRDEVVFIDNDQPYWVDFSEALNSAASQAGDGIADELVKWFVPVEETAAVPLWPLGLLGLL